MLYSINFQFILTKKIENLILYTQFIYYFYYTIYKYNIYRIAAMSSFQKPFAPSNLDSESWSSVPNKKLSNKSINASKIYKDNLNKLSFKKPVAKAVAVEAEAVVAEAVVLLETPVLKSQDITSRFIGPHKPPSGIFVNLGPQWKKFVRDLIPNRQPGVNSNIKDDKILDEITKIKRNSTIKPFDFKKIVCMIFHQAIKTDRQTLIERIIKLWSGSKYNMIELLDSIYDGCKPMTQACWSGSLFCIKTVVSADSTGEILFTVHPTKGETILQTLANGKNYAFEKDPQSGIFINDRFEKCEKFIKDAMAKVESTKLNASLVIDSLAIDPSIRNEIESIIACAVTPLSSIDQLSMILVDLFLADQDSAIEYFKGLKALADSDIFNQINSRLKDEGIELD